MDFVFIALATAFAWSLLPAHPARLAVVIIPAALLTFWAVPAVALITKAVAALFLAHVMDLTTDRLSSPQVSQVRRLPRGLPPV